jgi:hypothetical protein
MMPKGERPNPRRTYRRGGGSHGSAQSVHEAIIETIKLASIGSANEIDEYPDALIGKIVSREQFFRPILVGPTKVMRDRQFRLEPILLQFRWQWIDRNHAFTRQWKLAFECCRSYLRVANRIHELT